MKNVESDEDDDLRPEYDFSQMKGGVRGKYVERYRKHAELEERAQEERETITENNTFHPSDRPAEETLRLQQNLAAAPGIEESVPHGQVRAEVANVSGSLCTGTTQSRWPPGARIVKASFQRVTSSAPSAVRRATSAARSSVSMSTW